MCIYIYIHIYTYIHTYIYIYRCVRGCAIRHEGIGDGVRREGVGV